MNLEEAELEEQTTVAGTVMVLDVFLPHLFLNAEQANAAFFGDMSMGPKNVGRGTCEMALIVFFLQLLAIVLGAIFWLRRVWLKVKRLFLFLVSEIGNEGLSLLVRSYMIVSHRTKGSMQLKETII
jgi:hypothetical protein